MPAFGVKIDPSWQCTQCFQKVLAALRQNRPALPDGGLRVGELTPTLIPAPRSQERGRSLLCKIPVVNLPVGLGNCPEILRQADSRTLCLPPTQVGESRLNAFLFVEGWCIRSSPFRKAHTGATPPSQGRTLMRLTGEVHRPPLHPDHDRFLGCPENRGCIHCSGTYCCRRACSRKSACAYTS